MPSLRTRLHKLAERLQVCPIHGALLRCGPCHFRWTGTTEEFWELSPLVDRLQAVGGCGTPSGLSCPRCGDPLWCRLCYEAEARQHPIPVEVLTPAEWERYRELLAHMEEIPEEP